jgi:D-alanyl-D-alanine carboxypeptidase
MRRIVFLLLAICLISPKLAFATPASGKLAVKAALVAEYGSGKVLYSQDPDKRIAPASVTKIMTMYLVFDALASGRAHPGDQIRVSARADATGGSSMGLRRGETVTLDDLMRGMAVASGNDACIAIAEHFGGVPQFVSMMNRKARELGMTNTTFVNPNGLPAKGQLTTARDLMKLATSYLRHYPQALRYHSTTEINHHGAVHGNTNRLLGAVEGVDGIKTGFVGSSGYNIVATAKRGDSRIIAVMLGGRTKQVRNRETTRILEASFSGSVNSMLASGDDEAAPVRSHHVRSSRHHGKKMHVADGGERRSKISAGRGASARFDAGEGHASGSRYKSGRHAGKTTTHAGHHPKKKGASSR